MKVTILTEAEIRECVGMDQEAIAVVEDSFTCLANGEVTLPAIMQVDIPEHEGELDIKTAKIRGCDGFSIKVASGFLGNYLLGLRSGIGTMLIVSAKTGVPRGSIVG